MDEMAIVYTTWPQAEMAQTVGRAAVETGLAACANILAPMTSIYIWRGELQQEAEVIMLLKTRASLASSLRDFILTRHSYETPCVVTIPIIINSSNIEFLSWIEDKTLDMNRSLDGQDL